jgi:hypothetical protein
MHLDSRHGRADNTAFGEVAMPEHEIFQHEGLEELTEGVWRVKGRLPFPLHRNMVVLRLPNGELLLHSVVALDEAGMRALEALGKPAYAIVPHPAHMRDAAYYHDRFPGLKFLTPAVSRKTVEERVPVAGTVEEVLPPLGFVLHEVPATRVPEYIYEWPLPAGGRMLMVNDAFGGADASDNRQLMGRLLIRHTGAPGNRFGIARIYRLAMLRNPAPLKTLARKLATIPDLRLITVSHGEPVRTAAAEALLRVAG